MEILNAVVGFAILLALLASPYLVIKGLRAVDARSAEKNAQRLAHERRRTAAAVPGKAERAFLKSCTHCGMFGITLPFRDNIGRTYCSAVCMEWLGEGPRTFCEKCLLETTVQSSGNLHTVNGIGTGFVGTSELCSGCRSVIRRVWFTFFFLPVVPLRKYRVMQISPQQFLSRRVRD
jgi:hypothetical protein